MSEPGREGSGVKRAVPNPLVGNGWLMPIAAAAVLTCAQPAWSQRSGGREYELHRHDCGLAAQTVETGHPRPKLQWARTYIVLCKDEGPAALVSLWRHAGADSAEARYLITSSTVLRDARLYDEIRGVVGDRSRPDVIRVAAMLVLVRYAEPSNYIVMSDVAPPDGPIGRIPLLSRWSSGNQYGWGAEPLPSPVAPEILRVLTAITEAQSDSKAVLYAAAALARRVQVDIENGWAH